MKNKLYFNGAYKLDKRNRLVYTIVVLHAMRDSYIKIELIIDLIKEQVPERTDLIMELQKLKSKKWIRQAYISLKNCMVQMN